MSDHVWIGYCDLCNGQHCVTIEKADANVTRRPHSDSLARAHAEGKAEGRREMSLIDWQAVTEDLIQMLYRYIPGVAIVDEVHAVVRKHRKHAEGAPLPAGEERPAAEEVKDEA